MSKFNSSKTTLLLYLHIALTAIYNMY